MTAPIIKFDPSCFNVDYIPFHNDDNRVQILYGGRDSGKSHEIALKLLIEFMTLDYCKIILVRKVFRSIRDSNFDKIKGLIHQFGFSHLFKINETRLEIKYIHKPDNLIIAGGLDKPEKLKSLNDPTHIWYEEADQITEDDYDTTSLSLRSSKVEVTREYFSFNPAKECWIEDRFFPARETYERPDGKFFKVPSIKKDVSIYHMGYWNNDFISDERIEKLQDLKERNIEKYRVNTLGLWGKGFEGLVFQDYKLIDSIPSSADTYFGVDVGFSNPSTLVEIGHLNGSMYWDEIIYQKKLSTPDLVGLIIKEKSRIGKTPVVVDNASPSVIEELRRAGFNVFECIKGPNSVMAGLEWMTGFNHYITKDSCNIIQNFENYVYEMDKFGKPVDKPVKADDHAIDAGRYAAWLFGFIKGRWLTGGVKVEASSNVSRPRTQVRGGLRKSKFNR